jgi:hypothetical protein
MQDEVHDDTTSPRLVTRRTALGWALTASATALSTATDDRNIWMS